MSSVALSKQTYPVSQYTRISGALPKNLLSLPALDKHLLNKVILITGGASGFGSALVHRYAKANAIVIFGDINNKGGIAVEESARKESGNQNIYYVYCDVTSWNSQVNFFKVAVGLSPHGGIDHVIANAGVSDNKLEFERPNGLDGDNPPEPNLTVLDVNLKGVIYTAHLAVFWLPRNPGSIPSSASNDPETTHRDRHLVIMGSIAGIYPIVQQALYGASKHGVLGLWRCLRSSLFVHGIRTSYVAPYFTDTPIIPGSGRLLVAGQKLGRPEDVIEAVTRFMADTRIVGRGVVVGPRMKIKEELDGEWTFVGDDPKAEETAIHEVFLGDFDDSEVFTRRFLLLLNHIVTLRGWLGWASDVAGAFSYTVKAYLRT